MRTLLLVTAAAACLVPRASFALPPLHVSANGVVSPGFSALPGAVWPAAVSFTGTGTDPLTGTTYACSFRGNGTNVPTAHVTGFGELDCGPVSHPVCAFTLSVTDMSITCTTGGGAQLVVTTADPTNVQVFTVDGTAV